MIDRAIADTATAITNAATASITSNLQARFPFLDQLPLETRQVIFSSALNAGASATFRLANRDAPDQSAFLLCNPVYLGLSTVSWQLRAEMNQALKEWRNFWWKDVMERAVELRKKALKDAEDIDQ